VKRRGPLTVACLLSLVTAGLSLPANAASTSPATHFSATALLAKSEAATVAAGSVRVTGLETFSNGSKWASVLDSAADESTQTGKGSGQHEIVLVIGPKVFIYGNELYYLSATGKENPKFADRWVLVNSSSSLYHYNQTGELLNSLAKSVFDVSSPKLEGVVKYYGHQAVKISAKLPTSSSAPGSPQTIYISTTAPYLPLGYSLRVSSDDEALTAKATFSKWGETVKVVAPTTYASAS
jgi:hypothetical protein